MATPEKQATQPELQTEKWTVVVVARWNPAILTPKWIGTNVFKLPPNDETQIKIQIPFNLVGPRRFTYGDYTLIVDDNRVTIEPEISDIEHIHQASCNAAGLIHALPDTPYVAAGFNMHFVLYDKRYDDIFSKYLESQLKTLGYEWSIRRSELKFPWHTGSISVRVTEKEGIQPYLSVNFEQRSEDSDELERWLRFDVKEIESVTERIRSVCSNPCSKPE